MHPHLHQTILRLALFTGLCALAPALRAQVTEWSLFKGALYWQDTANVVPGSVDQWVVEVYVDTSSPGDAGSITISGGNLAGSVQLTDHGGGEWSLERFYPTQAAMNAEFPSNASYTLTISGGTLGTLTQSAQIGAEQYPNTPYLTGSTLTTAQQLNTANPTTFTWNNPGALTPQTGVTVFDIEERNAGLSFESFQLGAVTSATVPANTLTANQCHSGFLAFAYRDGISAGGFGVSGNVFHGRGTDFEVRTWPFPTAPCAWHGEYGAGCVNLALTSNDPILGTTWSLTTTGIGAIPVAFTFFSTGPLEPGVPLPLLGIDAPGCSSYVDVFSIVTSFGGTAFNGQLDVNIAIPAAQIFGGMLFYAQTVALTPLTPAGIGTSNSIEAMVGN